MYLFGTEAANRKEGLLGAALLTFSYQHVWFSQNARGYTALLFLNERGQPLTYGQAHRTFADLRHQLGWEHLRPRPRLHDLRHTFAVQRLLAVQRGVVLPFATLGPLATFIAFIALTARSTLAAIAVTASLLPALGVVAGAGVVGQVGIAFGSGRHGCLSIGSVVGCSGSVGRAVALAPSRRTSRSRIIAATAALLWSGTCSTPSLPTMRKRSAA